MRWDSKSRQWIFEMEGHSALDRRIPNTEINIAQMAMRTCSKLSELLGTIVGAHAI